MPFWKKKKKEDSVAFRREMAAKIAGKHIKYVTERIKGYCEARGGFYMLVPAYAGMFEIFFGDLADMGVLK